MTAVAVAACNIILLVANPVPMRGGYANNSTRYIPYGRVCGRICRGSGDYRYQAHRGYFPPCQDARCDERLLRVSVRLASCIIDTYSRRAALSRPALLSTMPSRKTCLRCPSLSNHADNPVYYPLCISFPFCRIAFCRPYNHRPHIVPFNSSRLL